MGTSKPSDQIGATPPVVVNNRLIIGERIIDNVNRDIPSGVVRAYDPVSGAPVWAWDVGRSPDAVAPLPAGQTYTRGVPNVWEAITADAANGIVYLGTGNASPDYWIGYRRRPGARPRSTSCSAASTSAARRGPASTSRWG